MTMTNEDREKITYIVQGMTCTNCAATFEKNVKKIDTVEDAQINFGASKLTIYGKASIRELEKAGAFDGLSVKEVTDNVPPHKSSFWKNGNSLRSGISALFLLAGWLAGNSIMLSGMLFFAAVVIGGYSLFIKGLRSLLQLDFNMNALMTIAIVGAAAIGKWSEAAVVVFLFAVSEALERFSMEKSRQSIRALMQIAPTEATILKDEREVTLKVEHIAVGDIMIVRPGQKIAMDGCVRKGSAAVNQSAITGESVAVRKQEGDEVYSGTFNEDGRLEIEVTKRTEDSTLAHIIHLVEEAQAAKAPAQKFVDRFSHYYTPAIVLSAAVVAILPPLFGAPWEDWFYRALALLVVGCPCALVISTPVAVVTAIGSAARNGVLVKGGIFIEEIAGVKSFAFDKTGTLTQGTPEVTDVIACADCDELQVLRVAAAIESGSRHPLADAVVRKAEERYSTNEHTLQARDFVSFTGKGAQAFVGDRLYTIGSPRFIEETAVVSDDWHTLTAHLQGQGKTVMLLAAEQQIVGLIAARDQIRDDAASVVERMKQLGVGRLAILTGDNQAASQSVAEAVGIQDAFSALLPAQKLDWIIRQKQTGKTGMIGDGVNDAPALAAADIGIAMGGAGSEAALETADVAIMGDDLSKLPYFISLSRKTVAIIKQNISLALLLKLGAFVLIIPGWLTLWMAIFADMGATVIVTLNSLRLLGNARES